MNITSLDGKISFLRDLYAGIDVRQRGMSYRVKVYLKTGAVLKSDYLTSEEEAMKYAGDLVAKAAPGESITNRQLDDYDIKIFDFASKIREGKIDALISEREYFITTSDGRVKFLRGNYLLHRYHEKKRGEFFLDVVLKDRIGKYTMTVVYLSLKEVDKAFEEIDNQLNK